MSPCLSLVIRRRPGQNTRWFRDTTAVPLPLPLPPRVSVPQSRDDPRSLVPTVGGGGTGQATHLLIPFDRWKERYQHHLSVMTSFILRRLPVASPNGRYHIRWNVVDLETRLAALLYRTSVNRYRSYVPVV